MKHDALYQFDRKAGQCLRHAAWHQAPGSSYFSEVSSALAEFSNNTIATNNDEFVHLLRGIQGSFGFFSQFPYAQDRAERVQLAQAALDALTPFARRPRRLYWKSGA
jgi:hypothetical protein